MNFSRSDFWKTMFMGEAIAILTTPILKNLNIIERFSGRINLFFLISAWMIALPTVLSFGLYLVYRLSRATWPVIFQVGKYGIVGLLNTFFTAGLFNLFIWLSGEAKGLIIDFFYIIAFCFGVTNAFFWNKFWTFGLNYLRNLEKEYVKFFGVSGSVALVNVLLLHIMVNTIGAPSGFNPEVWANIAYFSLAPVSFFGNFFGYRIFVFKKRHF